MCLNISLGVGGSLKLNVLSKAHTHTIHTDRRDTLYSSLYTPNTATHTRLTRESPDTTHQSPQRGHTRHTHAQRPQRHRRRPRRAHNTHTHTSHYTYIHTHTSRHRQRAFQGVSRHSAHSRAGRSRRQPCRHTARAGARAPTRAGRPPPRARGMGQVAGVCVIDRALWRLDALETPLCLDPLP